MQIIDVEQGTEEWHKCRMGIPTASNFNKLITSTGRQSESLKNYAIYLASEMLVYKNDEDFKSSVMEHGIETENDAIQAYQEYSLNPVKRIGFMREKNYGYSPDGLIGKDGLIEVKCPLQKNHAKYLAENKLPTQYVQQVQGGLFVSGRMWCDFVSFHPYFKADKKLFVKRVFRNEEFIKELDFCIKKVIDIRDSYLKKIITNIN